jgi:hypothetical protein
MQEQASNPDYAEVVGDMYARWVLDGLVEVSYAISKDFIARPEFYKGPDVPDAIVDLRMQYGTTSTFPNRGQRQEIYLPIFGASDGYASDSLNDKFRALRKPLFDACITLSELTLTTAAASLKPRVLSALGLLRQRLKSFDGISIRRSRAQVHHVTNVAYSILRSAGITHVFGVAPPQSSAWPLESDDINGSQLVRAVSEKLPLGPEYIFNEDKFQRVRLVAQRGREALQLILGADVTKQADFDGLVAAVYAWAFSIKDYSGSLKS